MPRCASHSAGLTSTALGRSCDEQEGPPGERADRDARCREEAKRPLVPLHILDTSALNDLVEPNAAYVRHRLITATDAGRILLPATDPLMWEVGATRAVNDAKYRSMLELMLRVSRRRLLLSAPARRVRELQLGGTLGVPGCLDPGRVLVPCFEPDEIDEASSDHLGRAYGEMFSEAERALDTAEGLVAQAASWRRTLADEFRKPAYVYDLADYYARVAMKEFEAAAGVDSSGLDQRALPTSWSSALIHAARVYAVMVSRVSPTGLKSPKSLDLIHLGEAASYGDVFVCSDRRLRIFAATVRDLRCEVLDFDEWASRLT